MVMLAPCGGILAAWILSETLQRECHFHAHDPYAWPVGPATGSA